MQRDMTYFEFTKRFPDENSAIDFIIATKYRDGYVCPKCGSVHKGIYHQKYNHRFLYCNNCKSEFSALKGTIFENTHLDLRMWLYAINLILVSQSGISALQLKNELGMGSYQSAWRMLQQIRHAIEKEEYMKTFDFIIEIDKAYVGAKLHNNNDQPDDEEHKPKRGRKTSKTPIIVVKEHLAAMFTQLSPIITMRASRSAANNSSQFSKKVCKDNRAVMTDQFSGYNIRNK